MASLGKDLAAIRKEQGLTLEDIQSATKIPKHILTSIEDDSIFTNLEENPTYIRSYIRSYAKALSIDEEQIVYALDQYEIGSYTGGLRRTEEESSDSTFEFDENNAAGGDDQDESPEETSPPPKEEEPAEKEDLDEKETSSPIPPEPVPSREISAPATDVHSVDWANMGKQFQPLRSPQSKMWLTVAVLVIIAIAVFMFFYFYAGSENPEGTNQPNEQQNTENPVSTDTLQLDIATPTQNAEEAEEEQETSDENANELQSQSLQTLPDTLTVTIYAAYGKLEPIRVQSDIGGGISPYWLEEGEAMPFDFVNQLRIRGQLDQIILLMNGHVISDFQEQFYNEDSRMLEIEREFFEDDNRWLQAPPDSLEMDVSPPSNILDRPTFN